MAGVTGAVTGRVRRTTDDLCRRSAVTWTTATTFSAPTARSSRRARKVPPLSESCLLELGTDDCLGEYRRMKERDVMVHAEPQSESWDTRVLGTADASWRAGSLSTRGAIVGATIPLGTDSQAGA